uniref:Uncharacterized protein n=1 Tax=Oryza glumipatula TaxID=40148 RepID=A0A0D9Z7G7_9ORYZ
MLDHRKRGEDEPQDSKGNISTVRRRRPRPLPDLSNLFLLNPLLLLADQVRPHRARAHAHASRPATHRRRRARARRSPSNHRKPEGARPAGEAG